MLKRLFAVLAAVACSGAIALSANLSLTTGPQPASDLASILNTLIQNINGAVGRISVSTTAASTTASTGEITLHQYTLPANYLNVAGDSLRVTCWGTTGADANNKTTKLYFGSSVISTATEASNAQKWWLDFIVTRRTATTQAIVMRGQAGTGSVTPLAPVTADAAETLTAAVTIKCTGTNGTASAGDITAQGMIVEALR